MPIVPVPRSAKVDFYRVHVNRWIERAAELGLDPAELAAMDELVALAESERVRQAQLRDAARGATATYNQTLKNMCRRGAEILLKIKARAASAQQPADVYTTALIPAPSDGSPLPPPGTATACAFRIIAANGAMELTWKCKHPKGSQGTVYEIHRRVHGVGGASDWHFLATVGGKTFIDGTLPRGVTQADYKIVAARSTRRGDPAIFSVQFGADASTARHYGQRLAA